MVGWAVCREAVDKKKKAQYPLLFCRCHTFKHYKGNLKEWAIERCLERQVCFEEGTRHLQKQNKMCTISKT